MATTTQTQGRFWGVEKCSKTLPRTKGLHSMNPLSRLMKATGNQLILKPFQNLLHPHIHPPRSPTLARPVQTGNEVEFEPAEDQIWTLDCHLQSCTLAH